MAAGHGLLVPAVVEVGGDEDTGELLFVQGRLRAFFRLFHA